MSSAVFLGRAIYGKRCVEHWWVFNIVYAVLGMLCWDYSRIAEYIETFVLFRSKIVTTDLIPELSMLLVLYFNTGT